MGIVRSRSQKVRLAIIASRSPISPIWQTHVTLPRPAPRHLKPPRATPNPPLLRSFLKKLILPRAVPPPARLDEEVGQAGSGEKRKRSRYCFKFKFPRKERDVSGRVALGQWLLAIAVMKRRCWYPTGRPPPHVTVFCRTIVIFLYRVCILMFCSIWLGFRYVSSIFFKKMGAHAVRIK